MPKTKESEMINRMKSQIDEVGHNEFVELYQMWFPWHKIIKDGIVWDVSGGEKL